MSLTISATTGIRFPCSASARNFSREGEIMVIRSQVKGSRKVTLTIPRRNSSTNARNHECRVPSGKGHSSVAASRCEARLAYTAKATGKTLRKRVGERLFEPILCGCSSVVEHLLAKEDVASSSLVTRSLWKRSYAGDLT